MSKKKRSKYKKSILMTKTNVSNEISKEELIEIQTEAYYKALKRIEDEKKEQLQKKIDSKEKIYMDSKCFICHEYINMAMENKQIIYS